MTSSSAPILSLLFSLPFSHPSYLPLLSTHQPFTTPSELAQQQQLTKLLNRLNTSLISRATDPESSRDRHVSMEIAEQLIAQDKEGYVLLTYGKQWLGTCLLFLGGESDGIIHVLRLLVKVVRESRGYPSFEREAVHPVMGKIGVAMGKLIEKSLGQNDWEVLLKSLESLTSLISHSPAPFRPLLPSLKPMLHHVVTSPPSSTIIVIPDLIRRAAASLFAILHTTLGKARSPAAWGTDVKEALGGIGFGLNGIVSEAWEEETIRVTPPPVSSHISPLPIDPMARLPISLAYLEGYTEIVLSLLRLPTARPVPIPVAQIVAAGLRCLSLTMDTSTVSYITPQHHAALSATLPKIWTVGLLLISGVAVACEDHLFPHLSLIFDHTVWLSERVPTTMIESRKQLLHFHHLLLSIYSPSLIPVEYPTRLLKICLSSLSPLLESKSSTPIGGVRGSGGGGGGGKRGKKRARNGEDGLVASLEGRDARSGLGIEEGAVIEQALRLTPLLHPTPLLAPSHLTFSIRLHLALHLALPSKISLEASIGERLRKAVENVLEMAVLMTEGEQGTSRGWKSVIISVLRSNTRLAPILHPCLPPMSRPQPPLSALHFFQTETEEEQKLRRELGFGVNGDDEVRHPNDEEQNDIEMETAASASSGRRAQTKTTLSSGAGQTASRLSNPPLKMGQAPTPTPPTLSARPQIDPTPDSSLSAPLDISTPTVSQKDQVTAVDPADINLEETSARPTGIDPDFINSTSTAKVNDSADSEIEIHVLTTINVGPEDEEEGVLELDSGSDDEMDEDSGDEDQEDDLEG